MDGLVPGKSLISDFLQAGSRDQFTSLAAGSEKKLVLPGLRRARSVQNSRLFQEKNIMSICRNKNLQYTS